MYKNLRALFCLTLFAVYSAFPEKKIVILDLGNVLVSTSSSKVAFHVGIMNFAYCFFSRIDIKQAMFDFLITLRGPQIQKNPAHCVMGDGLPLPHIWLQHMNGEISGKEVIAESKEKSFSWQATAREKETILRLIEAIFDPAILARSCMYPIKAGCTLLAELVKNDDIECWILSNLGADTLQELTERDDMHEAIFKHIQEEHRIVSGNIGFSKPQPDIYEHLKSRIIAEHPEFSDPFYMASHCIFIDDQTENITGSINAGIPAFHLTTSWSYHRLKGNYSDLRTVLKYLHYLT